MNTRLIPFWTFCFTLLLHAARVHYGAADDKSDARTAARTGSPRTVSFNKQFLSESVT